MKIGVIADSHRNLSDLYELCEILKDENLDMIFHLGDNYDDAEILEDELGLTTHKVLGNNDFGPGPSLQKIKIEGNNIMLTHGHFNRVQYGFESLVDKAKKAGCNCVCFGHTHVPSNQIIDNILVFNPGSLSFPRKGTKKSFGIIHIEENRLFGEIIKLK